MKKLRQWFTYLKIRKIIRLPGSIIARMLGIRCPNCGADTLSALLWNCTHCGYPTPTKLECPNCGLHMAHTDMGLCPKCGAAIAALQPQPAVSPPAEEIKEDEKASIPPTQEPKVVETAGEPAVAISHAEPAAIIASPLPLIPDSSSVLLPAPEPVSDIKTAKRDDTPSVIELPAPQPKEIPVIGEDFSVTIEQLADIFKIDIVKADAIYKEKVLRVKGTIEKVVLDDPENHYIILSSYVPATEPKVQCIFDKKYEPILTRLILEQRITVLGKYNGYDLYIRLTDCLPVA